jgi:hypothetical protein
MKRLVLSVAVACLVAGCGGADDAVPPVPQTAASGSAQAGTPPRTGPLENRSVATSCIDSYNDRTIAERSFAFDGTVAAIGPGGTDEEGKGMLDTVAVTFAVNEWFTGGTDETVTVDLMPPSGDVAGDGTPAYEVGTRLLVSGEARWGGPPLQDAIAWSCGGFTRYYEPAVADAWRRATA